MDRTNTSFFRLTLQIKTQLERMQAENQKLHMALKKQAELRNWWDKNLPDVEAMVERERGRNDGSDE